MSEYISTALNLTSNGILGLWVALSLYPQMGPLSARMTVTSPYLKWNIGAVSGTEPVSTDGSIISYYDQHLTLPQMEY
jgi:hypothetical protein